MHKKKYAPIAAAAAVLVIVLAAGIAAVTKSHGTAPARPPCRTPRPSRWGPRTGCTSSGRSRRLDPGRRRQRGDRAVQGGRQGEPGLAGHGSGVAELGPSNIGGRIRDMAADPDTKDVVYIATGSGGLWKSTDGGATFARAWDSAAAVDRRGRGRLQGRRLGRYGEVDHGGGSAYYGKASTSRPTAARRGRTWDSRTATRSAGSSSTRATTTACSSPSRVRARDAADSRPVHDRGRRQPRGPASSSRTAPPPAPST